MKYIERTRLTEEEYEEYKKICEQLSRSLRGQTAFLIREFLKKWKQEEKKNK